MIYYSQIVGPYLRHLERLGLMASNEAIPAVRAVIALLLSGEQQRAAEMLAVLPADGGSDAGLCGALGFIAYLRREGELAVRLIEQAVTLDRNEANNLALLAVCYLGVERHAQALAAFRAALRLDPALHVAHTLAWSAIARSGRLDGALRALKAALLDERHCAAEPAASRTRVEDTTLCIVDCHNHALAERALRLCMAGCAFDQVKWLTDRPVAVPGVQTIVIPPLSSAAEYSRFVLKDLLPHIETEFALLAQWDGYVVNPQAWSPEFLLFDYIGARWDEGDTSATRRHTVGNGGFSLRSRALLQALQDPAIQPSHPEDATICRIYREHLEDRHGIAFAPASVADRFSFEHIEQAKLPFGFHGITNLARFATVPHIWTLDFLFDGPEPQTVRQLNH